jgi:type IV pilus assembly protein PilM
MAISDLSFGIDFRENQLILTLLKKSFGKIRLVDYGVHSILPESQKEERENQIVGLINSFISQHQIDREKISISIPREKVVARFTRLPVAAKENLRKVLEYEAPKYTPFEKDEVYFDYHILKEDKEWVYLFAVFAKKAEVESYLSLLKRRELNPFPFKFPPSQPSTFSFTIEGWRRESSRFYSI